MHPPSSVPQSSVNQKTDKYSTLSIQETAQVERLSRLFQSPTLPGRALRTLYYYASHPGSPPRPQDLRLLLVISLAQLRAHRKEP